MPPQTFESAALVVSGPTASGKSNLAVRLCRDLGGEVVNFDSVQVYRGCDIGSAKLKLSEQSGVPHHLIDVLDPNQRCNVAWLVGEALAALRELSERKRLPVLCGGTGMYLTSLLHGLAELPPSDDSIRGELEALTDEALFTHLQEIDPETAERLHPHDRLRVIRAIETYRVSGEKSSELQRRHAFKKSVVPALTLVLCWDRTVLYDRINERARQMLASGLIAEVKRLIDEFGKALPPLVTLGYAQALDHLEGRLEEDELESEISRDTRRFAKRQMTYWRNEPRKRGWTFLPDQTGSGPFRGGEGEAISKRNPLRGIEVLQYPYEQLLQEIKARLLQPIDSCEVWYLDAHLLFE